MGIYELKNDFHHTSVRVRVRALSHIHNEIELPLSISQIRRAKRILCGKSDCRCSNDAGMRGEQIDGPSGKRIRVDFSCLY